jgi:hypothetical protein
MEAAALVAFVLCVGAAWIAGGRALRHSREGVDYFGDMLRGSRGGRGLLWVDFGKREDYSEKGWRYRQASVILSWLAVACVVWWGVSASGR